MWILITVALFLAVVTAYDLLQRKHAILRNFPVIGHLRYILESVGPELRQYIVTDNDEERPFSRDQRTWVYASAKEQNNYFGFGTDNKIELAPHYLIIKHDAFPLNDPHKGEPGYDPQYRIPCGKILGGWRSRAKAFRPESVINLSAMSYGSLSAAAVTALNRGSRLAGCLHNTGEGGVAPHHRHGGELIWQIGTGYFGCRAADGGFDLAAFLETVESTPTIKAIEIKLSQGAKPGLGGVLPQAKITPEIARIRRIERGRDCISPSCHTAFSDVESLIDFVEGLAERTGLPVGIKSAVGDLCFWEDLARQMASTGRGVDFITIDGGEGGTGAAPLTFADHVSLPFKLGFTRVYKIFAGAGLHENIVWIGSGKLGFPESALLAFGLGADMVSVAREAMLAIGCIQAQRCQTGHCPTGVATQNRWLMHGLDPNSKASRFANFVRTLRKEMLRLSRACGVSHPTLVTSDHIEILDDRFGSTSARELFAYQPEWGHPSTVDQDLIAELMATLDKDP